MAKQAFLLKQRHTSSEAKAFAPLHPNVLQTAEQVRGAFARAHADSIWIAFDSRELLRILADLGGLHTRGTLLIGDAGRYERAELLRSFFGRVIVVEGDSFLPLDEIAEVLTLPNSDEYFIGGILDRDAAALLLIRGNFTSLVVPLSSFASTTDGVRPNWNEFAVTDSGQTIRFGSYEASGEALLYENDADFRKRLKARRRGEEKTFGASLRRLRLQRGLRQDEFRGVTERQIGRIERGDTGKPRSETLRLIATRLGVAPEEIEQY